MTKTCKTFSARRITALRHMPRTGWTYHLRVQTSPHSGWIVPAGWSCPDADAAAEVLRQADSLWMCAQIVARG